MDHLSLRKVPHQAPNNYRVILKTEHDGEFEIGSIGVQTFTSNEKPLRLSDVKAMFVEMKGGVG
jgi:hypothetical protein